MFYWEVAGEDLALFQPSYEGPGKTSRFASLNLPEKAAACRTIDGTDMSRVIVVVACGLGLAGCTSGGGMNLDWWPKFEPTPVSVQFQSEPAGAEAKTSVGQSCQTPCALAMPPDKDFAVTFSLAGYQPLTIPVQVSKLEGSESASELSLQPNPVAVELSAAPKTPAKRTPAKKPATTASASKPAAAKPAAPKPAAAKPAAMPSATDPWPPAR